MTSSDELLPGEDEPSLKSSRLGETRRIIEEYAAELREIIKNLRKRLKRKAEADALSGFRSWLKAHRFTLVSSKSGGPGPGAGKAGATVCITRALIYPARE